MTSEIHIWAFVKEYVVGLLLFIFSLFGWQMKRNQTRIDSLEKTSVPREEFNDTVRSLRTKMDTTATTLTTRIDDGNKATHQRLDRMLEVMAAKD